MSKFITLYEIFELYFEAIRNQYAPQQAERIINEFRSAVFRFLLPAWGFKRVKTGRKMSGADVQGATAHTKTLHVQRLLRVRERLQVALDEGTDSPSSRTTYGNRIEQFLQWAEAQSWWPCERLLRLQAQCRPPQRLSGRRHYSDLPLTSRTGQYLRYRLTEAATPPLLQAELEDLDRFLVAHRFPGRVFNPVKPLTRDTYMKDVRLILGFFCEHKQEPVPLQQLKSAELVPLVTEDELVPLQQLKLADLVPLVTEDELESLTYRQQQKLWREKQLYLETWLCEYFRLVGE